MALTLQNICEMTEKPFVSADAKTRGRYKTALAIDKRFFRLGKLSDIDFI